MNDPKLVLEKLESLISGLSEDQTTADKAAVFSAVRWCVKDLEEYAEEENPTLLENLERVRWHTSAMLGYDITNGHDFMQHKSWAMRAVTVLQRPRE